VSANIIEPVRSTGGPVAREYGGLLSNRSFGGNPGAADFLCGWPDRSAVTDRAYQALERQIALGNVDMYTRHENAGAGGDRRQSPRHYCAEPATGNWERHFGHTVLLCTGGYGNVFIFPPMPWAATLPLPGKRTAKAPIFANPCFTQIHPTCIPVSGDYQSKLTLMSESLRNDGRIWVPKKQNDTRSPKDIPEEERDYYLERRYPAFGNLVPRDVASRAAKERC